MSFPFKVGDVIFRNWPAGSMAGAAFLKPDNLYLILEVEKEMEESTGISGAAFARLLAPSGQVFSATITSELWIRVEP